MLIQFFLDAQEGAEHAKHQPLYYDHCPVQQPVPFGTAAGHRPLWAALRVYPAREPGTTQDAIAREIYVNKSNVTRQLAALEQNGFVERRPCETDSRAMEVYPTEKALAVLPEVRAVLREWNECITADFTEEEKEQFKDLLARAAERAQQRLDEMKKE